MSKKTVKVSMELPELPEGYEYTGEYRAAGKGEYYLVGDSDIETWTRDFPTGSEYPIIRKCEVWRDATAQDVYSALSGVEVFVRYGGKMLRLVGGQRGSENYIFGKHSLSFLLKQEDLSTFWTGACEVQVS